MDTEQTPAVPVERPSPAVAAVLESNPTTPSALLHNVLLLMDLNERLAARPLLKQLTDANLDEDQKFALWRQFGSAALLRLAASESLAPEGQQLALSVLKTARERAHDPERIATLIRQLGDASAEVRRAAQIDLLEAKTDAVGPLLSALADVGQVGAHAEICATLTALGPLAVDPLLAASRTADTTLQTHIFDVCGQLGRHGGRLVPFLVGPAALSEHAGVRAAARRALQQLCGKIPDEQEAARMLTAQVRAYLEGTASVRPDHQGQVVVWHWNDEQCTAVPRSLPDRDAAAFLATRLAGDLVGLDPERDAYRRLHLACRLETDKILHGFATPLSRGADTAFQQALALGPRGVEDVLGFALAGDHLGAALGAVQFLGEIGDSDLVRGRNGRRSVLVQAMTHGDRRLRFAAINAVLKLDPSACYPGSSAVPEGLGFFVTSTGARRAIVADPRPRDGQTLASMLGTLGYDAEVATVGRRLVETAAGSADVELLLVQMTIERPPVRELLYRLRCDCRTARLPIALIASLDNRQRAETIAAADPWTAVTARPGDPAAMAALVARLTRTCGRAIVPVDDRNAQALAAIKWFVELSARPQRIYDLYGQMPDVERALCVQQLRPHAMEILTREGLATSQKALLDLASRGDFSPGDRQRAAAAFRSSVARHGILLTSEEILHQYDRYNASEKADQPTQQLLSSILDTIETKDPAPN